MNKIVLIGYLGNDPNIAYTASGVGITTFRLAVRHHSKSASGERQAETVWFNIITFRQLAETCATQLMKGHRVYITGCMHHERYTDKNDVEYIDLNVYLKEIVGISPEGAGGSDSGYPPPDYHPSKSYQRPSRPVVIKQDKSEAEPLLRKQIAEQEAQIAELREKLLNTVPDIEGIAMKKAWAFEEENGAKVTDVSTDSKALDAGLNQKWPGYDLISVRDGKKIMIEVKGHKGLCESVELTGNEYRAAAKLGDQYWLYVVYGCATQTPTLSRIQDPNKLDSKPKDSMIIKYENILAAAEEENIET